MSVAGQLVRLTAPLGGFRLARWMTRRSPRVLMYHRFSEQPQADSVSARALDLQLAAIARDYETFTLAEAIQHYYDGDGLPENALVLTIDDGYRDFHDVAWPLFRKHGVKATLFVTTGFIDRKLWLWPDRVKRCVYNGEFSQALTIGAVTVPPGRLPASDYGVWCSRLFAALLAVEDEVKNQWLSLLEQASGLGPTDDWPDTLAPCDWQQLRTMQAEGLEVGGHTVSHPSLGRVSRAQAAEEISECARRLEAELGPASRSFCYPNGTPDDYTPQVMEQVKSAGFVGAVTAFHDALGWAERYAIRRYAGCEDLYQFNKALHGVEWLGNWSRRRVLSRP